MIKFILGLIVGAILGYIGTAGYLLYEAEPKCPECGETYGNCECKTQSMAFYGIDYDFISPPMDNP